MLYVYVLFSKKDHSLYVGYTSDLKRRWNEHCMGYSTCTKYRRPLHLIYYEAYLSEYEARRRERYLKGGNGREGLKKQLSNTLEKLEYRYLSTQARPVIAESLKSLP